MAKRAFVCWSPFRAEVYFAPCHVCCYLSLHPHVQYLRVSNKHVPEGCAAAGALGSAGRGGFGPASSRLLGWQGLSRSVT